MASFGTFAKPGQKLSAQTVKRLQQTSNANTPQGGFNKSPGGFTPPAVRGREFAEQDRQFWLIKDGLDWKLRGGIWETGTGKVEAPWGGTLDDLSTALALAPSAENGIHIALVDTDGVYSLVLVVATGVPSVTDAVCFKHIATATTGSTGVVTGWQQHWTGGNIGPTLSGEELEHNELDGLQGGDPPNNDYFHLSEEQLNQLIEEGLIDPVPVPCDQNVHPGDEEYDVDGTDDDHPGAGTGAAISDDPDGYSDHPGAEDCYTTR